MSKERINFNCDADLLEILISMEPEGIDDLLLCAKLQGLSLCDCARLLLMRAADEFRSGQE
jgi:hypothetical protein